MVFIRNSARQNISENALAISSIQNDLQSTDDSIELLNSSVGSNTSAISQLQTDLGVTNGRVSITEESISTIQGQLGDTSAEIVTIKSDIGDNEQAIVGLNTSLETKQDEIDSDTIISLHTLNASNDVIASRKVQAPLFNIVDGASVSHGTINIVNGKATVDASEYLYLNSSSVKRNIGADIEDIQNKLNCLINIVVDDKTYDLPDLLDQVRVNKSKLETFVDQLNDAVGDDDSGVVNLMEQVSQSIADLSVVEGNLASEVSNRDAAITNLSNSLNTTISSVNQTIAANATSDESARQVIVDSVSSLQGEVDALETKQSEDHELQQNALLALGGDKQNNISVGDGLTFTNDKVELDYNDTPTESSVKPISSGGLFTYKTSVDSSISGINSELSNLDGKIDANTTLVTSNATGLQQSINTVKALAYQEVIVEGEVHDSSILFSHGMLPIETGFGIGIPKKGFLEGVHILTDQSSDEPYSGVTNLNIYIDIYDANNNISTQSVVASGRRTNISYSNVELPSSSAAGGNMICLRGNLAEGSTWLNFARIRITLLLRSIE